MRRQKLILDLKQEIAQMEEGLVLLRRAVEILENDEAQENARKAVQWAREAAREA